MILVPNPPLPLNGNNFKVFLSFLGILIVFLIDSFPLRAQDNHGLKPVKISILLPLNLSSVNLDTTKSNFKNSVETNGLIWNFYQGLLLGLDSAGRKNLQDGLPEFHLRVMDTGEDTSSLKNMNGWISLDSSDLIIGPIYPDQIKWMGDYSQKMKKFIISPFSPHPLSQFNNPRLIMMNSPLEAYSIKTAEFIQDKFPVANIMILETGVQDRAFYQPMLSHFSYPPKIIQIGINDINTDKIPVSQNLPNIFIVPSMDKAFWSKLVVYLSSFTNPSQLNVFAHPNFSRLKIKDNDLLQGFHLHFPSGNFIDREDPSTLKIYNLYKSKFFMAPDEYSFLGYDMGIYFGEAIQDAGGLEKFLKYNTRKGIHNDMNFLFEPGRGYWNHILKMLEYRDNGIKEDQ